MDAAGLHAIHFAGCEQWRDWLSRHHNTETSIWLIFYKKHSPVLTVSYSDAIDEALCFGWVDGKVLPMDEEKYTRFFSRRKKNGTWSKVNKEKIERLIGEGRMTTAGFNTIEAAKQNGSWATLDEVEELVLPDDLKKAFRNKPKARRFFNGLCRSDKRNLLQWLVLAKRTETRQKRVSEIVNLSEQNMKPAILKWTKK